MRLAQQLSHAGGFKLEDCRRVAVLEQFQRGRVMGRNAPQLKGLIRVKLIDVLERYGL